MKKKRFISDKEADFITDKMVAAFGPVFADILGQFGGLVRHKDVIRFMPLAARCKEARDRKSFSAKEVASLLKVPKYRINYIEDSRVTEITPDILEKYIDLLGIRRWFNEWVKNNADVHKRIHK